MRKWEGQRGRGDGFRVAVVGSPSLHACIIIRQRAVVQSNPHAPEVRAIPPCCVMYTTLILMTLRCARQKRLTKNPLVEMD
jgi:hypothetical protein